MPFKPGQSGNPKGRPLKARSLTNALEREFAHTTLDTDGKMHSNRSILARVIRELLLSGEAELPGGKKLVITPKDWQDMVFKTLGQVDGPPKLDVDLGNNPIHIIVEYADKKPPE